MKKINELEKLYGSIYNVDLFAGGILEVIRFNELDVNLQVKTYKAIIMLSSNSISCRSRTMANAPALKFLKIKLNMLIICQKVST